LSYTEFKYALVASSYGGAGAGAGAGAGVGAGAGAGKLNCNGTAVACVEVSVTNTGAVAGAEVVQLYLTFPSSAMEPSPTLRGFQKTGVIAAGARK
jgi:hypothetical protein